MKLRTLIRKYLTKQPSPRFHTQLHNKVLILFKTFEFLKKKKHPTERENVPYGVGNIFLYQPVKLLISAAQLDILTWQYVRTDSLLALAYRLYFSALEAAT